MDVMHKFNPDSYYSDDLKEEGEAKWWKWFEGTVELRREHDDGSYDLDAIKTNFAL